MSLLGREYLSVAVEDDPPGPGGVRPTTRPHRLVTVRHRPLASVGGRVVRPGRSTDPRRTTR